MIFKNKIFEIITDDYSDHGCDYKCNQQRHCNGDCKDGDSCTCLMIIDTEITETSPEKIFNYVNDMMQLEFNSKNNPMHEPIHIYALQQLLIHHEFNNEHLFEVCVKSGYYGDEVTKVTHSNHEKFIQDMSNIFSFNTNTSKIEYLLNLKHGYIPEHYKELNWENKKLVKSNIQYIEHNLILSKNNTSLNSEHKKNTTKL